MHLNMSYYDGENYSGSNFSKRSLPKPTSSGTLSNASNDQSYQHQNAVAYPSESQGVYQQQYQNQDSRPYYYGSQYQSAPTQNFQYSNLVYGQQQPPIASYNHGHWNQSKYYSSGYNGNLHASHYGAIQRVEERPIQSYESNLPHMVQDYKGDEVLNKINEVDKQPLNSENQLKVTGSHHESQPVALNKPGNEVTKPVQSGEQDDDDVEGESSEDEEDEPEEVPTNFKNIQSALNLEENSISSDKAIAISGTAIVLKTEKDIAEWREKRRKMWLLKISNNKQQHMKNMGVEEAELVSDIGVSQDNRKHKQFIQSIRNQITKINPTANINIRMIQREMAKENRNLLQFIKELGDAGKLEYELNEMEKSKLFGTNNGDHQQGSRNDNRNNKRQYNYKNGNQKNKRIRPNS